MKRCPDCRRDYYDDSLLYCLDDGSALLEGPGADWVDTAILSSGWAGVKLRRESLGLNPRLQSSHRYAVKTRFRHQNNAIIH